MTTKGIDMAGTGMPESTALHAWDLEDLVLWEQLMTAPSERQRRSARPQRVRARRGPARPGGATLAHAGTGVRFSRATGSNRRRSVTTTAATIGLALLAGLVTLWLGALGHLGGSASDASASVPGRLAIVQVHSGETLAHVAARVAPDLPVGQVVDQIRELNTLGSSSIQAGQTLIAPVN